MTRVAQPVRRAAAVSYLRLLCSLSLPPETVMPFVLRALRQIVPSTSNAFFWVNERYDIKNICAERVLPLQLMRQFFAEFQDTTFKQAFAQRVRDGASTFLWQPAPEFYQGELYRLIWRRLDAHHAMYAIARDGDRPIGQLSLYRAEGEAPFGKSDQRALEPLVHYIARALAVPPRLQRRVDSIQFEDDLTSAIAVVDHEGSLRFASPDAQRLLFMAQHGRFNAEAVAAWQQEELPKELRAIGRDVITDSPVSARTVRMQNEWGEFSFRAYRLEPVNDSQAWLGITIQHRVPVELRLLARMPELKLAPRQQEVALLWALGYAQSTVSERLRIGKDAVRFQVKQIFNRLGVNNRQAMIERMLAEPD